VHTYRVVGYLSSVNTIPMLGYVTTAYIIILII